MADRNFEGQVTAPIAAPAEAIFELITDVERLAEWNQAIERVLERRGEVKDDEWMVMMHVPRLGRWKSRSYLQDCDRTAFRYAYRSKRDDRNPTDAQWTWDLVPGDGTTEVTVRWELHPKTFFRKVVAAPIRQRQLVREVQASLEAIQSALVDVGTR